MTRNSPPGELISSPGSTSTKSTTSIQFIVAHYNEDLNWLLPLANESIIYTKGPSLSNTSFPTQAIPLPNIGREGHTYLHHIVSNYECLPEICVFLQGKIDDHVSLSPADIRRRASQTQPGEVTTFPWRELELFDCWSGIPWSEYPCWKKWTSMKCKPAPKTPGQYFVDLLGYSRSPASVGFQPGAIFAVHRDTIRQHPLSFYQNLLDEFFLGEMQHINPETGHYLERLWLAIWAPEEYICWDEEKDVAQDERNRWGQLAKGRWHRTPRGVEKDEYTEGLSLSSDSDRYSGRGSSQDSDENEL